MAFYQMLAGKDSNLTTQEKKELVGGVYASTGGNPSAKQFEGLLKTAKEATFHLGFDMDDAGMKFADMFKDLADKVNIPSNRIVREETNDGYKDFNEELLAMIERKNHPLAKGNVPEEYKAYVDSFRKERMTYHPRKMCFIRIVSRLTFFRSQSRSSTPDMKPCMKMPTRCVLPDL